MPELNVDRCDTGLAISILTYKRGLAYCYKLQTQTNDQEGDEFGQIRGRIKFAIVFNPTLPGRPLKKVAFCGPAATFKRRTS
jgi:hypothetical protein